MKLHTFEFAPNPQRLQLFLAYKGIELPGEPVNLRELEQFSPKFQALNPRCIVPTLELDDGTVLCDVIAICWYLESRFPQRPLLGRTPLEQAQVLSWDLQVYTDGFLPVAEALRNWHRAFKDRAVPGPRPIAQIPELEARGRIRIREFWERLDEHLAGRDFVVGDAPTLADIDVVVTVDFAATRIKETVPPERGHLTAWLAKARKLFPLGTSP